MKKVFNSLSSIWLDKITKIDSQPLLYLFKIDYLIFYSESDIYEDPAIKYESPVKVKANASVLTMQKYLVPYGFVTAQDIESMDVTDMLAIENIEVWLMHCMFGILHVVACLRYGSCGTDIIFLV